MRVGLSLAILAWMGAAFAQEDVPNDPQSLLSTGADRQKAIQVSENIYYAVGFGNTFMVTTDEGNVIIDTSLPFHARRHVQLLKAVDDGPVKYIVLTHGHGDHRGGVQFWKEPGTEVIAQENYREFRHYQERLSGFFSRRNAAQFGGSIPLRSPDDPNPGNFEADIDATITFDDTYAFELGGTRFELYHTPGETYDHLSVWIPEYKAAFTGDNFYGSFPNIYTLRGTKPRWALDYVLSLDTVLAFKPEILLPSHGAPIKGNASITKALARYRDAIRYVHDATVAGMNAGKSKWTLMQEIALPLELDVGEAYGRISWSVRGIYEGYVGWFDGGPASLYSLPAESAYPELVGLAGGADKVLERIEELEKQDHLIEALHLTDANLVAHPKHADTLELRIEVLKTLRERSTNSNESGWLDHAIREAEAELSQN